MVDVIVTCKQACILQTLIFIKDRQLCVTECFEFERLYSITIRHKAHFYFEIDHELIFEIMYLYTILPLLSILTDKDSIKMVAPL